MCWTWTIPVRMKLGPKVKAVAFLLILSVQRGISNILELSEEPKTLPPGIDRQLSSEGSKQEICVSAYSFAALFTAFVVIISVAFVAATYLYLKYRNVRLNK